MPVKRRFRRRAQRGRGLRTFVQAVSVAGAFSLILLAGAGYLGGAGGWWFGGEPPPQDPQAFRLGSIVLVPWSGKMCEERQFDNLTGRIVADGLINCESKLWPAPVPISTRAPEKDARMRAIFGAFQR